MNIKEKELICLDCVLPDCDESSGKCLYNNPLIVKEVTMGLGGNNKEKSKENLARKPEITEVLQRTGFHVREASDILGIPQSTLSGLIRKWKLRKEELVDEPTTQEAESQVVDKVVDKTDNRDLIDLFEKVLAQTTIERARACWEGVKIAKGL